MAGMGPPPKHPDQRARTNKAPAMHRLPATGREGDPPAWPVGYEPTGLEVAVWSDLWATPQAVAWERFGWFRVVARYTVAVCAAERNLDDIDDPKVYAALLSAQMKLLPELRQLEDRLGLSPLAMLRLQWEIAADEVGEKRDDRTAASKGARARYAGLRAVGGSSAPEKG